MVSKVLLLIFTIFSDGVICRAHGKSEPKNSIYIVGGHNTTIEEAPYQAYLIMHIGKENFDCGGSIISARYILTAAHCLFGYGIDRIDVRIGSADRDSGGTVHTTNDSNYLVHPKFTFETIDYDVAVIRLNENMKLDGKKTKAIEMPKENAAVPANTEMLVTGWGRTSEEGPESRFLKGVKVSTFTTSRCQEAYRTGNVNRDITERMICAGDKNGEKDHCTGDSGGPAVHKGVQLGIVSFAEGCARKQYPGVYTKVSAVRQWIKKSTGF